MATKKMYILDTNVLLYDPASLFSFEGSQVGIPIMVLEELDTFKSDSSQKGFHSREVIRQLDALRERGSLSEGVALDNGCLLKVLFVPEEHCDQSPLPLDVIDNSILFTAWCEKQKGVDVHFVSKDLNARVKSDVIGIPSEDYSKDKIPKDTVYKGWVTVEVPAVQLKQAIPEGLVSYAKDYQFALNEFALVQSQHNPFNYVVFRYVGRGKFIPVKSPDLKWPLEARNPQQLMALNLLLDDSIQFVSLVGAAGTGKTFLALLAGLYKMLVEQEYEKMLVTRPVVPLGPDIGYLPGDISEKLRSWMQPVYDNMEFITHSINMSNQMAMYKDVKGKKSRGSKKKEAIPKLEELIAEDRVSLEAITYMRGRSIPYQFIFIDEVQNLTPHEVKTLISRVGEGSKIIIAGDPYQIDSPYLDFSSNGLVVASSKFRGQAIFGNVFLESSERSELSKLAQELL